MEPEGTYVMVLSWLDFKILKSTIYGNIPINMVGNKEFQKLCVIYNLKNK